MVFRYGISPQSLQRWQAFQQISKMQDELGPDVGWQALTRIIDAELEAIDRATAACEQRGEEVFHYVRPFRRSRRQI